MILSLLLILTLGAATNTIVVEAELKTQSMSYAFTNNYTDLKYLLEHSREFEGVSVTTNGTVRYYASIYMFEDFWLEAQNDVKIPVEPRFAGLAVPQNEAEIEISGIIEHSTLEGGFYFLNASS